MTFEKDSKTTGWSTVSMPKIMLERELFPHHLPLLAAEKTGDLEIIEPESCFPSLTPLHEGRVQFALTHPAVLVKDFIAGKSVAGVAFYLQSRGGFLCRSTDMTHPENLSNKLNIGGWNLEDKVVSALLNNLRQQKKLEPLNFSVTPLNSNSGESLKKLHQGELDIIGPATIIPEGLCLQTRGWKGDFIFFDNYNLPEIGQLILVASRDYSDNNPNQARDLVHAVHKEIGVLQNNHDKARKLYESRASRETSEILLNSSLSALRSDLSQDHQLYENWANLIADATGSKDYVNLDLLLDERFLPIDALGYPMDI